jgi:hypothetical protein
MKHFRIGSKVVVERCDGRGEIARLRGIVMETLSKTSWSPRGYMISVNNEDAQWYPEKYVFKCN